MEGTNFYTKMAGQTANHYSAFTDTLGKVLIGKFDTAATPDTTAGKFQKGCLMTKTDAGGGSSAVYQNTGTLASPTWTLLDVAGGGGGITELTGDVTAGPGSGSQVATVAAVPHLTPLTGGFSSGVVFANGPAAELTTSGSLTFDSATETFVAQNTNGPALSTLQVGSSGAFITYNNGGTVWGFVAENAAGGQTTILANNVTYVWPNAGGTAGQALIDTAGNGVLGWQSFLSTGLAEGNIWVGNGALTAAQVAMSGDATMDGTGLVTVASANADFAVGGNIEVTGGVTNPGGTLVSPFYPSSGLPQALSGPGAITITEYQTHFTSTGGGDALTLAVATHIGHEKKITYVAEGAGADTGVITPAAVVGYATVTLNAVGDYVVFFWTGAAWAIKEYVGATVA